MILPRGAGPAARVKEWRRQERLRQRLAASATREVLAWQRSAGEAAAAALQAGGDPAAAVARTAPALARVLSRVATSAALAGSKDLRSAAKRAGLQTGTAKARALAWEVKEDPLLGAADRQALISAEQIGRYASRRSGQVARDLAGVISAAVAEADAQGEGQAGGAKLIQEMTGGAIGRGRAGRIARTETHGAAQAGALDEARRIEAEGVGLRKVWLATEDDRTRESHRQADGQSKQIDQGFDVGGAQLRFPGDPNGPPAQVINCRCAIAMEPAPAAVSTRPVALPDDDPALPEVSQARVQAVVPTLREEDDPAPEALRLVERLVAPGQEAESGAAVLADGRLVRFSGNDRQLLIPLKTIMELPGAHLTHHHATTAPWWSDTFSPDDIATAVGWRLSSVGLVGNGAVLRVTLPDKPKLSPGEITKAYEAIADQEARRGTGAAELMHRVTQRLVRMLGGRYARRLMTNDPPKGKAQRKTTLYMSAGAIAALRRNALTDPRRAAELERYELIERAPSLVVVR